jgi:hypothetical protein
MITLNKKSGIENVPDFFYLYVMGMLLTAPMTSLTEAIIQ